MTSFIIDSLNNVENKSDTWGRFHKLFCALRPIFEKPFKGVERALRRAPKFYEIDPRKRKTFFKTKCSGLGKSFFKLDMLTG